MNILVYVNLYPPTTNAGAELMLHEIVLGLRKRGHNVLVAQPKPTVKQLDGVQIISYAALSSMKFKPDVVFTQNHDTKLAIAYAESIGKPLVHFVHNDRAVRMFGLNPSNANLVVSNSDWVSYSIRVAGLNKIVFNPPLDMGKYCTVNDRGGKIAFINPIDIKGADIFWQITRLLPDREFLVVEGGYGKQILRKMPNVEIIKNTDDMKSVYARTRLLLVPSRYESWGRVGLEAMSSGIPVIASKTPGLRESIGTGGILVSPGDVAAFVRSIKYFDDGQFYDKYAELALARANEVAALFDVQLDELESRIVSLAGGE